MANPVITFGADGGFGAQTGWALTNTSVNTKKNRANVLNETGDEVASELYDEIDEVTSSYTATTDSPTIPADIGAVVNTYCLTSIALSTSATAHATMSLTGHNHAVNAHGTVRSFPHSITLTNAFGCTDFGNGTAGDNASPESSSVTITCDHVDVIGAAGSHLVGENHNPRLEFSTTWAGVPTAATGVQGPYDLTSDSTNTENTGFVKTVVSGVKAITVTP